MKLKLWQKNNWTNLLDIGTNLLFPTPYFIKFSRFKGDQSITLGNQTIVSCIFAKNHNFKRNQPITCLNQSIGPSFLSQKNVIVTSEPIDCSKGTNQLLSGIFQEIPYLIPLLHPLSILSTSQSCSNMSKHFITWTQ